MDNTMPVDNTGLNPKCLSNTRLIAYSTLAIPLAIVQIPILIYLPAFYAKEMGLNMASVGIVFLLARCWDALSDLLIGWLSDHSNSRLGCRKPWIVGGAPFLILAMWFLCQPPEGVGLIYLVVWTFVFYIAQTAMLIPYWSWGAELADDYAQRNRIVAFRESGTIIGNLIFAIAPVLLLTNSAPVREVLLLVTLLVTTLIVLAILPLSLFVSDRSSRKKVDLNFFEGLKVMAKNVAMIRILMMTGLLFLALGVINSIAVFLIDVGLGLPNKLFLLILIQYTTSLICAPLVAWLANRFGKNQILLGGISLVLLAFWAGTFIPTGAFLIALPVWVMIGIGFSCVLILPFSMLADIIDYDQAATGEKRSGTYMAAYNLALKIGLAVGVGVAFGLLSLLNYDATAQTHSTQDVMNLRIIGFFVPSLFLIPAIVLLQKFPITKQYQQQLREAIEARESLVTANNQIREDAQVTVNAKPEPKTPGNSVFWHDG